LQWHVHVTHFFDLEDRPISKLESARRVTNCNKINHLPLYLQVKFLDWRLFGDIARSSYRSKSSGQSGLARLPLTRLALSLRDTGDLIHSFSSGERGASRGMFLGHVRNQWLI
jgi:hypothetical protein